MGKPVLLHDGNVLVGAHNDALVAYNCATHQRVAEMRFASKITALVVDGAGRAVTTVENFKEVRRWDLQTCSSVKLDGPTKNIDGVQYVDAMHGLVTYGKDGDLFIFDAQGTGKKLEGPRTTIKGVQYVEAMHGLVTYGFDNELFIFDAQGQGKKLEGPTKEIKGVRYVEAIHGLVTYGEDGDLFIFDAQGKGKKLEGPTKRIWGLQYVGAMDGLVTYGEDGDLFIFDAQGQGKKLEGPTKRIWGVQYVGAMDGLVTYGNFETTYHFNFATTGIDEGELFIFNAQGQGKKLEGPRHFINGVQYVQAMHGLVTYGRDGELFIFDAQGQGKKLEGPRWTIRGVRYVEAMDGLVTYGNFAITGEFFIFDAQGQGKKLEGPRRPIEGVQYVQAMHGLVSYGLDGELFIFDAQGQGKKLKGPSREIKGVQYVQAMHGLVTYGEDDFFVFDAQGQGKKLEGPRKRIKGVQYVEAMRSLVAYGEDGDLFIFDAQGQGKKLEGPTEIMGVQYVEAMHGLVTYGKDADLFIFDAQGTGKKLGGHWKTIKGVQYVEAMHGLVAYGDGAFYNGDGAVFIFDAQGHGKRLWGVTRGRIDGVRYVDAMHGLVVYGKLETFEVFFRIFDAQGRGKILEGPRRTIEGVQYVQAMHGLVSYGESGELFIFDAQGQGKKLEGPTKDIKGVKYVQAMHGLVSYGGFRELFIFDAQGQGKKLEGPTKEIKGVQYVEAMHGLVTYGEHGDLFIFDAQGQGKKLEGPTKRIQSVQYVGAMGGLVTYGDEGDLFIFDAQGQGKKLKGPTDHVGGCKFLFFESGFVVAGGSTVFVFGAYGERVAMKLEDVVQDIVMLPTSKPSPMAALFGSKRNVEVAVFTALDVRRTMLVNVSLGAKGFLAVRPYSKALSSKMLDLPKRYGLEVSIASFCIQAGFIVITLLQVLGAAYQDVEPPAELQTPAHALQPLQHMGLDPEVLNISGIDPNLATFSLSLAAVLGMVAIFWAQEFIEFRKFMEPDNSTWPLMFDVAGAYLSVVSGPMFLPLLQAALLPMHQLVVGSSEDETQVSSTAQYVLSLLAGSVLTVYALRFTRVDKQLVRINATGWGMVSGAMDLPPTEDDRFFARRHPLSPMSPKHDLIKTLVKVALVLIRVGTKGVVGAFFRFLLTVGMVVNDWCLDEFLPNQRWDFNAMVSAGSAAVAWNTLASIGAAVADEQGQLEDWGFGLFVLNMTSIPVAALMYSMRQQASKIDKKADALSEPLLP